MQSSLKLTREQRSNLMQLRRYFFPRLGHILRKRESISTALAACSSGQHQVCNP